MKLLRAEAPFFYEKAMQLWIDVFGAAEALPEMPHVDGSERTENRDVYFLAEEDGVLLGTIHGTVPRSFPELCGISGMCTLPAVRGKGLGRMLFQKIVEEMEALGVKTMFLGTENPIAAKLYHSCGFSFLPGSNVMARFQNGFWVDYERELFGKKPETVTVSPGKPGMRIPLVPLVLHRGEFTILDCNTGLLNSTLLTQPFCMSLYPKYQELAQLGGAFYQARNERNVLGAAASVMQTERGRRADFFCCESFREAVPALLDRCGDAYLQIGESDEKKQQIAEELGYTQRDTVLWQVRNLTVPCRIYEK